MKSLHTSTHLLTLALSLVASLPPLPHAAAQQAEPAVAPATVAEQYLLAAANQARATRGLPLLHRDEHLVRAAAQHAHAMSAHETISHQFPDEPALARRAANAGLAFSLVSENVAEAPSAVEIHEMWMHSEHHRENLLDPSVDAVGIRVIARNGELYAVEDFAKTLPYVTLEEQESAIGTLVARPGQIALLVAPDAVSAARQTCTMSSGFAGSRKPGFIERFTASDLTQLPEELATRISSGRYRQASVGACAGSAHSTFASYSIAVLLYP
jgi:uncharacterized protein YkwD